MKETIYILKDYGKINIKLKEIMFSREISRSKLSRRSIVSYDLVNRYYNNKVTRIDLDVISRFCYILNCDIYDILEYTKSS